MTDIKSAEDLKPGNVPALRRGEKSGLDLTLYGGRVLPQTFGQVVEFAQMMCKGGVAIPKHLRENPGACLSVIQRSMAWEMDPWAVATKTYAVNDILAYEAQLIAAVVKKWAPIKEKVIPYKFEGEGAEMSCSITLHHIETGEEIYYQSPKIKDIEPKNSPLWKTEKQQQLSYYSIRALCRRHFAEILLGVYDRDEAYAMRDVTPPKVVDNMLNDDPPGEALEGEMQDRLGHPIVIETKAEIKARLNDSALSPGADGKAGDDATVESQSPAEPAHNPETGELFDNVEETVITPELLTSNMVKSIKGFTDKVMLEEYQHTNQVAINGLPAALSKQVRKALSDRHIDLEEL